MLKDVKVPKKFEPIFEKAQKFVRGYFDDRKDNAERGTIEISGERYLLVRAASMSVDFFATVRELYKDAGEDEALTVARSLLFDIAHAIGRTDAKNFHKKMKLKDPVERLSAGPIHFAHSGWAFVDIFPESKPSRDENCLLIYDHPYSFESDAWIRAGKKSDCPVCVMNAGYSSGWTEESFGVTLVASEIMCKAKGDKACRFIMAHPTRIEGYIREYIKKKPALAKRITKYEIPGFFRRKQVELSLRESEERYRKLFEHSNDAIFIHTLRGEILDVNSRACEMLGYDCDALMAMLIPHLHPEQSRAHSERAFKDIRKQGSVRFESTFQREDTSIIDVDISARIIDPDKGIVQGIVRDISERKRVERDLMQKEREIRLIAESSVDMIFLLSKSGRFVYVSPSCLEIIGYQPEEMVGEEFARYVPEGELATYWTKLGEVFIHRKINTFESFVVHRDGHHVPVEINGRVTQLDGQFVAQGTLRDITERRSAENELREREQEFRLIFENAKDAIFWADPKTGTLINCNRAAEKLLEKGRSELIGRPQTDLHPPDKADYYARVFKAHIQNKGMVDVEGEVVTKSGNSVPVDITASVTRVGERDIIQGIFHDLRERKHAERTLAASEKKYRTIFETSPEAIVLIDTKGFVIDVNDRVREALGFEPDDVRGKHLLEMPTLTEQGRQKGLEAMQKRLQGENVPPYELDFMTHDGKRRTGLIRAQPLRDEEGKVFADLVMISDITERKRAEEGLRKAHDELEQRVEERTRELEESQKLYQTLAEVAEDFIFIVGSDMKLRYVNTFGAKALFRNQKDIIGKPLKDFFPEDIYERMKVNLGRVFRGKKHVSMESMVQFPTGSAWLHSHLTPIKDECGDVVAVMGLSRNITDRREAENALRQSEERYRSLFEDSPISLWEEDFSDVMKYVDELKEHGVCDFNRYFDEHPEVVSRCAQLVKIVDVNRATLDLYGFTGKDDLVRGLERVFTDESVEVFKRGMAVLAGGGKNFHSEAVNKSLAGDRIDIDIHWSVAPGHEADCSKMLVSIMNITERKKLENEVRRALKVKSEFMSTMSHELRTPLSHIISCTDVVLSDPNLDLPERRTKNLSDVLRSSDKLLGMINNVLDMARIEAGRVPIRPYHFSLQSLIAGCVETCRLLIGDKPVGIVLDIDESIPELFTDRDKLGHILDNLIGNAIKFSDRGEVRVAARPSARDPEWVTIEVSDQGPGIPEDKLGMIFEQFRQVDSSSTRRHEGMGLGLAIVKAYVNLLRGDVDVRSEVGLGSTFAVNLPFEISYDESMEDGVTI